MNGIRTQLLIGSLLIVPLTALPAQQPELADDDVQRAVEMRLIGDESVPGHVIDVSVQEGVATLSGVVNDMLSAERAVEMAGSTRGVRSVVDQITVRGLDKDPATLEEHVSRALLLDPSADSYELEVTGLMDGRVRLEGTVDSWAEKRFAIRVAKGVPGVREIEDAIDVRVAEDRSDAEIRADVRRRLRADAWVDHTGIGVEVTDGVVTLSGNVATWTLEGRAASLAHVAGVREVEADDLSVEWWHVADRKQDPAAMPSDEQVEQGVRDALLYDPRVLSTDVQVSSDDGMVTLSGAVDDLRSFRAAEEDARNTRGVWRVRNHLRVRFDDPPTDERIAALLRERLEAHPFLEADRLTVDVRDQEAVLYGTLRSEFAREEALRLASETQGVAAVDDNLVVHHTIPTALGDRELEAAVRDRIYWNPLLDGEDIRVEAKGGVVTLTGEVSRPHLRELAGMAALRAGARRVENELRSPEKHESSPGGD